MFKYEIEINNRLKAIDYRDFWETWGSIWGDEENTPSVQNFLCGVFGGAKLSAYAAIALKKYYRFTKDGLIRVEMGGYKKPIPNYAANFPDTISMPCATSECDYPGLYFMGQMGISPEGSEYYLVKIGSSETSIKKRVQSYATYNPMIYHNNISLHLTEDIVCSERRCHQYLARRAYGVAQNSVEWFYVDKETYFSLCENFKNETFFAAVASGCLK